MENGGRGAYLMNFSNRERGGLIEEIFDNFVLVWPEQELLI